MMRIDRYAFISSAVIPFYVMSGSDLVFGISVSEAKFVENTDDRNKKKQPRGLTLTGTLWFGPTGCSKSFTSAACVAGCHVCYHAGRVMSFSGSLISPSTSQSPPSKSASDSLIFSFFWTHQCTENFLAKSICVWSTKLPSLLSVFIFPCIWCEWKRKGSVPEHALINEPGQIFGAAAI